MKISKVSSKYDFAVGADIFDELHVDGIYDVAESIESSLSDNGKTIVPETVPDTVWNWLSESHADSMSLGTLRPEGYYFTLLNKVK